MSESAESNGAIERVFDRLSQGGLPEIIAGPAGKAISRLIGGVADVPAAKLEQMAQAIRDRTKSNSMISDSVAKKAAEIASTDDFYVNSAIKKALGKADREFINTTEVVVGALDHIANDKIFDAKEIDDDWLNVFEDAAGKASSDSLRDIFSRILAGEIRKSGTYSPRTIQFFSSMSKYDASVIQAVAPCVVQGIFLFSVPRCSRAPLAAQIALLSSLGILNKDMIIPISVTGQSPAYYGLGKNYLLEFGNLHVTPANIFTNILTQLGQEIFRLIDADYDLEFLLELPTHFSAVGSPVKLVRVNDRGEMEIFAKVDN